jgi:hypothetical protein
MAEQKNALTANSLSSEEPSCTSYKDGGLPGKNTNKCALPEENTDKKKKQRDILHPEEQIP